MAKGKGRMIPIQSPRQQEKIKQSKVSKIKDKPKITGKKDK